MTIKIRSIAFVLLMIVLFSGIVHGKPLQEGVTDDGIYYGKGYDAENPNLLIGGILQKSPNPDENTDYKKYADDNQAIYVPTYYSGGLGIDLDNMENIKKDIKAVNQAALGEKTDYNGLNSPVLSGKHYDTIIAYSGGTATALTALAQQGVICDTLILISPMSAAVPDGESKIDALFSAVRKKPSFLGTGAIGYNAQNAEDEIHKIVEEAKPIAQKNFEAQINDILIGGGSAAVKNIIVIQSTEDKLPYGDVFQYRFPRDTDQITVHNVTLGIFEDILGKSGVGHKNIIKYAMENIINPPASVDVLSVGTLQSDIKWQETRPTDASQSDTQGTNQTASQSTHAKSVGVTSPPSSSVQQAIDDMKPLGEYNHYESTIPIPSGSAADALKIQGKYEEYLQNALLAAEERIAQDSQDGDAWYTKGLALYYLNRAAEADIALAKAKELDIQFESNDKSFSRVSQVEPTTQALETVKSTEESKTEESTRIPTLYPITSPPPDESNTKESTRIPTLYPITSPPPDESNIEESSRIPTLYPITSPPPDESIIKESSTTSRLTESKFGDTSLSVAQPVDSKPDLAFGDIKESSTTDQSIDTKFGDSSLSVTIPADPQPDLAFGDNKQTITQTTEPAFGDKEDVPSLGIPPEDLINAEAWNDKGIALFNQGNYKEAIKAFNEAISLDQHNAVAWNNKGNIYRNQGHEDLAEQCFDKVADLQPDLAFGDNKQTITQTTEPAFGDKEDVPSLGIPPEDLINAEAWNDKGIALFNQGNYKEAIKAFNEAISLDPNNAVAWNNKGNIYRNEGHEDLAEQCFDKVADLQSDLAFGDNKQTITQTTEPAFGDKEEVPSFGMIQEKQQTKPAEGNGLQEAIALFLQGKDVEAALEYNKACGLGSSTTLQPRMYLDFGDSLFQLGKYDEAIQVYKKIFDLQHLESFITEPSLAWTRIGNALNKLGRMDEANDAFAKAKELEEKMRYDSQDLPLPTETWQDEDKMIRATGGYSHGSGYSGGLTSGQKQAIEDAINSMEPVGEYNHYESTVPVYNGPVFD